MSIIKTPGAWEMCSCIKRAVEGKAQNIELRELILLPPFILHRKKEIEGFI